MADLPAPPMAPRRSRRESFVSSMISAYISPAVPPGPPSPIRAQTFWKITSKAPRASTPPPHRTHDDRGHDHGHGHAHHAEKSPEAGHGHGHDHDHGHGHGHGHGQAHHAEAEPAVAPVVEAVGCAACAALRKGRDEYVERAEQCVALAALMQRDGHLDDAARLYRGALAYYEKSAFGPTHKDVGVVCTKLGFLHKTAGRLEDAQSMFERALRIDEGATGLLSTAVARDCSNLGSLMRTRACSFEARTYLERALAIWADKFGPEHINVAHSAYSLGVVLFEMSEFEEAQKRLRQAVSTYEDQLGEQHETTMNSKNWLLKCRMKSHPRPRPGTKKHAGRPRFVVNLFD